VEKLSRKFVRILYRSGIRGRTRTTLFLARRLKSLQSIPVTTKHGVTIYVDLRLLSTHGVFLRWGDSPEDEDVISSVVQAGDVVYDIGAHIGLYTVMFSRRLSLTLKYYRLCRKRSTRLGMQHCMAVACPISQKAR
jgi:hypothetical protein